MARKTHCKHGHELVNENIYVNPSNGDRACRTCRKERADFWNARRTPENIEKIRIRKLWALYEITEERYQEMWAEQKGLCYLCGQPELDGRRLSVDHDHRTEQIRKLLCRRCNTALGSLNDDVALLLRAVQYLREHSHEHLANHRAVLSESHQ